MQSVVDTAIQWLHDTIRCQVRIQREVKASDAPGEWVALCWEVGHSLAMMQAHGIPIQPVIEAVSAKLRAEFGQDSDWTPSGIRVMRQFYLDYFERPELQAKLREVNWACHKYILEHCRDPMQQEFYLELSRKEGMDLEALIQAIGKRQYETASAMPRPRTGAVRKS